MLDAAGAIGEPVPAQLALGVPGRTPVACQQLLAEVDHGKLMAQPAPVEAEGMKRELGGAQGVARHADGEGAVVPGPVGDHIAVARQLSKASVDGADVALGPEAAVKLLGRADAMAGDEAEKVEVARLKDEIWAGADSWDDDRGRDAGSVRLDEIVVGLVDVPSGHEAERSQKDDPAKPDKRRKNPNHH